MVPRGPGLCRAHRSSSVIGTGMQKPPVPQVVHGELVELSVTGAQELVAVADDISLFAILVPSIDVITDLHGATVGAGIGAGSKSIESIAVA